MKKKIFAVYFIFITLLLISACLWFIHSKSSIGIVVCMYDLIDMSVRALYFIYTLSVAGICYYILKPLVRVSVITAYRRRDRFVLSCMAKCTKSIVILTVVNFALCVIVSYCMAPYKICNWNQSESIMAFRYGNVKGTVYSLPVLCLIYFGAMLLLGLSLETMYIFFHLNFGRTVSMASILLLLVADKALMTRFPLIITRATIYAFDLFIAGFEGGKWLFYIGWFLVFVLMTFITFGRKNLLTN